MKKLVEGVRQFQSKVFTTQRELYQRLAGGQQPEALFITCADSRVNPNLITQTDPGELFILRNAGNIIPPYGAVIGGEGATIEYAVCELGVKDIIVCGHSLCGAMKGLLHLDELDRLPAVKAWLAHAEATRRIVKEKYQNLEENSLLTAAIEENVLVQIENLRTHPCVASGLAKNELRLHGWVYKIETGQVFAYDSRENQFVQVEKGLPAPVPNAASLTARRRTLSV
jgi:carbonic anhydrase